MAKMTVKDLMLPLDQYATIGADQTLCEALRALEEAQLGLSPDRRHHHRAVLVIEDGRVVGKLSHWAVLKALDPKRLLEAPDFSSLERAGLPPEFVEQMQEHISTLAGGLDRLGERAARIRARDAMVPTGESIDEHASLIDTIHVLARSRVQSLVVTRGAQVAGVLRMSDVFEAVAEYVREGGPCG